MALLHSCNLVVADGVQLIVGDWSHLGLELGELNGDVLVVQCLQGDWVGGVVYKHIGVNSYLHQVDNVIVNDA